VRVKDPAVEHRLKKGMLSSNLPFLLFVAWTKTYRSSLRSNSDIQKDHQQSSIKAIAKLSQTKTFSIPTCG
jgi:hypothetical protein